MTLLAGGATLTSHAQKTLGADTLHALPPTLPGPNADPHIAAYGDTYYLYPTTASSSPAATASTAKPACRPCASTRRAISCPSMYLSR
jgi:hypothetical protein